MNCLTQLYNVDSLVTDKGTINLDDRIAGQLSFVHLTTHRFWSTDRTTSSTVCLPCAKS